MLPIVLEELCVIRGLPKDAVKWKDGHVTKEDIATLNANAADTTFDRLRLKGIVMEEHQKGNYTIVCKESPLARIVAVLPKGRTIPIEDWTPIFQMFGNVHGRPWNIYWYGSTKPREFPTGQTHLEAEHLNGGYTTLCSTAGIFVYRLEEATRVLIHELLHAACMDPKGASIQKSEATIETWAELILVAHRSKGSAKRAQELLAKQLQWVANTNHRAATEYNTRSDNDYGWRYLNGREEIYASLGFKLPAPRGGAKQTSTRFSCPVLGD